MKRKILILPIETKARELEARLSLAGYAMERGYAVYIGSKAAVARNYRHIMQGVLFHKDAWKTSYKLLDRFKSKGSKIVGTDEEGLVILSDKIYLKQRIDNATLDLFDQFYMWGAYQQQIVSSVYPNKDKLIQTGNSRIDFLRKEFHHYSSEQANSLKKEYGRFIMINTKLSAYNHGRGPEGYINMFRSQGMFKNEEDEKFRYEFQEYIRILFERYLKLIPRLSKEFPEINFVLRPHPSENINTWLTSTESLPNVFVNLEGSISKWIWATEAVIHTDCTTGIESVIAGKPAISFRPTKPKKEEMFLPNALSKEVYTEDDLIILLSDILNSKTETEILNQRQTELLNYYLSNTSGKLATTAILDKIDELQLSRHSLTKIKLQNNLNCIKNKIKNHILRLKANQTEEKDSYSKQKFSSLTVSEVHEMLIKMFPRDKYTYQTIDDDLLFISC